MNIENIIMIIIRHLQMNQISASDNPKELVMPLKTKSNQIKPNNLTSGI